MTLDVAATDTEVCVVLQVFSGLGWRCNVGSLVLVSLGSSASGNLFQVFCGVSGIALGAWRSWSLLDNVQC